MFGGSWSRATKEDLFCSSRLPIGCTEPCGILQRMGRNKKRQALSTILIFAGAITPALSYSFSDSGTRNAVRVAGVVLAILGCVLCIHFYLKSCKED
jgi:drug/metabolite transporter (DMT)-like permease